VASRATEKVCWEPDVITLKKNLFVVDLIKE
jgi:hypothetical protein